MPSFLPCGPGCAVSLSGRPAAFLADCRFHLRGHDLGSSRGLAGCDQARPYAASPGRGGLPVPQGEGPHRAARWRSGCGAIPEDKADLSPPRDSVDRGREGLPPLLRISQPQRPSTSAVQATTSCGVLRSASTRAKAASTSPAEVTSAATARRRPTAPSASRGSAARSVPGRVPGRDCALAGEMNRDRLADPAARAGHNSDLPGQRCRRHGSILTQPAHPLAAPEIVAAKRAQPLQWGVSLKRLRDRCDSRLTCIGSGPQVLVYWPDGFSGRWSGAWPSLLPVPDCCRFVRRWRVKGRAAPACGAAGALDAARRGPAMGGRGREPGGVRDVVQRSGQATFLCG